MARSSNIAGEKAVHLHMEQRHSVGEKPRSNEPGEPNAMLTLDLKACSQERAARGCRSPSPLRRVFAAQVRARKNLGMSQEELADRAEVHGTFIGAVERSESNISIH